MDPLLGGIISRWFDGGLEAFLGTMLEAAICLSTAAACGVLVGYERRADRKAAGIRTHVLVCVGASAFVHLGLLAVGVGATDDFARLIQSIATGIGFLGAGAIFRGQGSVSGITTASSIWLMGAVGAAAGAGAIVFALMITLITFAILQWSGDVPILEKLVRGDDLDEEPPPP
jgi:putative Mg2+ transporter-C (MgtC) family protein